VVDVRDDREVADVLGIHDECGRSLILAGTCMRLCVIGELEA